MAAKKKKRAAKKSRAAASAPLAKVTGKVVMAKLASVKPNDWNPNRMTEFQVESTRAGMVAQGWLAAYALLVWGKDENGKRQNVIIDGEHRWHIARDLAMREGPMVFLDGITRTEAQKLTIALDNKRGQFDRVALRELIGDIGLSDGLGFELGFDETSFAALMDPGNALPPSDFSSVDINAQTTYRCPKCGYEWNGSPAAKKKKARKKTAGK